MSLSSFKPIIASAPRGMILGSMPSVTSLAKQEYYGFKHNRFWKIVAAYYQTELLDYSAKQECIKNNHLILCNGRKSYELYQRHIQLDVNVECVCLPSTSNANRTISQEKLFELWFEQLKRI